MKTDTVTKRPKPTDRVSIKNVVEWQEIRASHDQYGKAPGHMLQHVVKALGPIGAWCDHNDHQEEPVTLEEKRLADLIISSIWLVNNLGYDPAALVANRMWDLGIAPKREEMAPEERSEEARHG